MMPTIETARNEIIEAVGLDGYDKLKKLDFDPPIDGHNCAGLVAFVLGFEQESDYIPTDTFTDRILPATNHEILALGDYDGTLVGDRAGSNICVYRTTRDYFPSHIAMFLLLDGVPHELGRLPGGKPIFREIPWNFGQNFPSEYYRLDPAH